MRKTTLLLFIFIACTTAGSITFFNVANAQPSVPSVAAKLPYEKGESFVVTQGYHSPPTHIKKDDFALDLTQNGCDAYGKLALAAVPGTVLLAQDAGYDGGYGTQVLLESPGKIVTRYAHMIPGSLTVSAHEDVAQGTPLGEIGDTGLVAGNACATHPGTHIHFAMDTENDDGTFAAKDPEPISGYTDMREGHWYISDNAVPVAAQDADQSAIVIETAGGKSAVAPLGNQASGDNDAPSSGVTDSSTETSPYEAASLASPENDPVVATATSALAEQDTSIATGEQTPFSDQENAVPTEMVSLASDTPTSILAQALATAENLAQLVDAATEQASSSNQEAISDFPSTATTTASQSQVAPPLIPQGGGGVSAAPAVVMTQNPELTNASSSAEPDAASSVTPSSTAALPLIMTSSTTTIATSTASSSMPLPPSDDVQEASSSEPTTATSSVPLEPQAPQAMNGAASIASFDSSTLAVDFAWQSPNGNAAPATATIYSIFLLADDSVNPSSSPTLIATTTGNSFSYPLTDADYGKNDAFAIQAGDASGSGSSPLASTTVSIPAWFSAIQPVDDNESFPSWYSDNWYDLGTGFRGTIRSLALEGYINSDQYGGSTLALEEFSDADYTALDHTFPISPTPFTNVPTKITVPNLTIPLSPEKYYRLTTVQAYQNRSVILKGTDATGTAMWDNYVYAVGGVQYPYTFYPYLSAIIDPEQLPIRPPVMQGSPSFSFNDENSEINVSWPAANDPDEPNVALNYEINLSTSTTLDPTQWQSLGNVLGTLLNVTFPNAYTIGVRALDDFNDPSQPITASWSFPADYAPVPDQFDHSTEISDQGGSQEISFAATTTVSQVNFWLAHEQERYCCSQTFLSVYKDDGGKPGEEIPSGNPVVTFDKINIAPGEEGYPFSSPITFSPGIYWFSISTGPSDSTDPTEIYGSPGDAYPGGYWSGSPGQDAFFRLVVSSQ